MSRLCKWFGHRGIGRGWWGDGLYGRVEFDAADGVGVAHLSVMQTCHRCEKRYRIARFHGDEVLRKLTEANARGVYNHAIFTGIQAKLQARAEDRDPPG